MKRTGEMVLGVIGAIYYAFIAVIGALIVWVENNRDQVQDFFSQAAADSPDAGMTEADVTNMLDSIGNSGAVLLIISLLAVILGIVAMVFIKGNKKPKAAGIIFIATAVIFAVISFGAGLVGGILYLIAGIMCLVRKPKTIIYE